MATLTTIYCLKQNGIVLKRGNQKMVWDYTIATLGDMKASDFRARGYVITAQ